DRSDRTFSTGSSLSNPNVTGGVDAGATIFFDSGSVLDLRIGATGIGADSQSFFGALGYRMEF
ncbi:MAG: hypothetical protein AAGP08_12740, partial [Pseudomonadota bacterium]